MKEAEADAKFPRPRGLELWTLRFRAWRYHRREDRFHKIHRIAQGAHAAGDFRAFAWCVHKLDRLGGKAWSDYLKGRHANQGADLASELRRLGVEFTPGQLRWIEAVLPGSYRS